MQLLQSDIINISRRWQDPPFFETNQPNGIINICTNVYSYLDETIHDCLAYFMALGEEESESDIARYFPGLVPRPIVKNISVLGIGWH